MKHVARLAPRLGALVLSGVLAACAPVTPKPDAASTAAPAPASAVAVLAPNANLVAQGIPPVPMSLVDEVAKYTDFRGHLFADWHPTKREMLVAWRKQGANTSQLYRLASPMAEPEPLTDFPDPVTRGRYEPREGRYVVVQRAVGGNEAYQLYRIDLPGKEVTAFTEPNERHEFERWLNKSSRLLYTSVPLDRTAQGGTRDKITQTLTLVDPARPTDRRKLADLPGGGWSVGAVSWDDRTVALVKYVSANESEVWLMTLATGRMVKVLPAPGAKTARSTNVVSGFSKDNASLFVTTDVAGEFQQLVSYRIANRRITPMTKNIPWDAAGVEMSHDGRLLATQVNVDGRDELRLFDGRTLKALPDPKLPPGSIGTAEFHHALPELAFTLSNSQGPSQIFSLNPSTNQMEQWTRAYAPAGVDTSTFSEQSIVRWKSFDGREMSGMLSLPPARFTGRLPVVISIHGGPESQAKIGFLGRSNFFVNELGVALIQPNVRGSTGYGKTFLDLDNGAKREDSVKDIGALLDWIATQPNLDPTRVLVMGGSYGGYMTLAVATNYADRIAGAVDIVGIPNFVTFLQNTESYRRDLRRVEYGDERDPAMRELLTKISPLTNAAKITKPLFVVQGKNDPRVPYTEAEQIVAKAREIGTPVWYLRGENEGHGFSRKDNADFQFYATVLFMQQTLLKR